MMKLRNSLIFLSLVIMFLFLIQIVLFSYRKTFYKSKIDKSLDYFKTTVNWSQYPIVEECNQNHILVLGEARSGTSFLADLIHQSWPTFYSFEPLFLMKRENIRNNPRNSQKAVKILLKIFECDFGHLDNLSICLWKNARNIVMKKHPGMNETLLLDKPTNRFVCQRCDNLLIKSIRISVKQFIELQRKLKKPIKLIFIVRDPRGVMSSRFSPSMDWCRSDPKCAEVKTLCRRMEEDLNELIKFNKKSPEMVSIVRYEDLSLQTMGIAKVLFKKFSLKFNLAIEKWIESHTNNGNQLGDPYSTARQSKRMAFSWINRLNITDVNHIQQNCNQVMNLLGYNLIDFNNFANISNESNFFKVEDILRHNFELGYMTLKTD